MVTEKSTHEAKNEDIYLKESDIEDWNDPTVKEKYFCL